MTENKISVVVPMYNSERYIKRCIVSLMNQTYSNLEIIVVDDGSTDNSKNIINELIKVDNRIKLFVKKNGGVSSARNLGLEVMTGDLVSFVDSDDFVDTDMYRVMVNKQNNYDADIVECGYKRIYNDNELSYEMNEEIIVNNHNIIRHYLLGKNTKNYNCNKIYKRKLFNDVKYEKLTYSEDYLVNIKTHSSSETKVIISNSFYNYFDNIDSAVNAPFSIKKIDQIKAGIIAYKYLEENKFNELILSLAGSYILERCLDLFKTYSKERSYTEIQETVIQEYRFFFRILLKNRNIHKIYSVAQFFSRLIFYISPTVFGMMFKLIRSIKLRINKGKL